MKISDNYGTAVVELYLDDDRKVRTVVTHSDDRIAVSRELLAQAAREDWPDMSIDGDALGFCGTHAYRATGEVTPQGEPIYALVVAPEEKP